MSGDAAASRTVRVGAVEIACRVDGPRHAPALVLAGSLGTTFAMWDEQVAALCGRYRIVRFDARGHGGSGTPAGPYTIDELGGDLVGVLDALGIGSASLCGLSLGAMVVMWVAAHAPERVERLVLACGAPELGPAAPWHERARAVRRDGTASLFPALAARWFTPGFAARAPATLARVRAMLESCSDEGYAACCEAIAGTDLRDDVRSIRAETLVVAAASDPVVPPRAALALAEAVPGAALAVLPDASHLANLEQPTAFTAALAGHLGGDVAARGEATRRAVLGDRHVERAHERTTELTASFQDLLTRYAWGELWGREGLDRRTRSAVTIAMLVALGRLDELALHVAGGVRNGLERDEIAEILLHAAAYCGLPAANAAFAVAGDALREMRDKDEEGR